MLDVGRAGLLLYVATGSIAYLGVFLSRFTGEHFLDKSKPKNEFDALFFHGMAQALLVYAIAIPFAIELPSSAPLSVGILAGLMWIPLSWIVTIRWIIVAVYLVSILVLETRWRRVRLAALAG